MLKTSANPKAAKKKKKAAEKVLIFGRERKGKAFAGPLRGLEATERIILEEESKYSLFDPGLC